METQRIRCSTSRGPSLTWLLTCLEYDLRDTNDLYVVPWKGVREKALEDPASQARRVRVMQNTSPDMLLQVRAWRACRCGLQLSLPRRVLPGDWFTIEWKSCRGVNCGEGQWWLRWFAPGGKELMWPFVW